MKRSWPFDVQEDLPMGIVFESMKLGDSPGLIQEWHLGDMKEVCCRNPIRIILQMQRLIWLFPRHAAGRHDAELRGHMHAETRWVVPDFSGNLRSLRKEFKKRAVGSRGCPAGVTTHCRDYHRRVLAGSRGFCERQKPTPLWPRSTRRGYPARGPLCLGLLPRVAECQCGRPKRLWLGNPASPAPRAIIRRKPDRASRNAATRKVVSPRHREAVPR